MGCVTGHEHRWPRPAGCSSSAQLTWLAALLLAWSHLSDAADDPGRSLASEALDSSGSSVHASAAAGMPPPPSPAYAPPTYGGTYTHGYPPEHPDAPIPGPSVPAYPQHTSMLGASPAQPVPASDAVPALSPLPADIPMASTGPGSSAGHPPDEAAPAPQAQGSPLGGTKAGDGEGHPTPKQPNIVVIMADDQDLLLGSLDPRYMPQLNTELRQKGAIFRNFITPTATCCPSRSVFLTGKLIHNTNVTTNYWPHGGFRKFQKRCFDQNYLPVWLQRAGYSTYFVGKFLNEFYEKEEDCPGGWDVMDALVDPYTYVYYKSGFSLNCGPAKMYPGVHQTDVIIDKAKQYITAGVASGKPFFLELTPVAPHLECAPSFGCRSPPPPKRYAKLYSKEPMVRGPNWSLGSKSPLAHDMMYPWKDWDTSSGAVTTMRDTHRDRLRNLRGLDDLVGAVVATLEAQGVLDNTYIVYTADNGFHLGQHGMRTGKELFFEEEVRLPLLVRGPGIPSGLDVSIQASMTDLAPTLLAMAGAEPQADLDGIVLPLPPLSEHYRKHMLQASSPALPSQQPPLGGGSDDQQQQAAFKAQGLVAASTVPRPYREAVLLEFWGYKTTNGLDGDSYRALRLCSQTQLPLPRSSTLGYPVNGSMPSDNEFRFIQPGWFCYTYAMWCNGKRVLFDTKADPYQTVNRWRDLPAPARKRLDAMLAVLSYCQGVRCANPFPLLHPQGDVRTLAEALDPAHDAYYLGLPDLAIRRCANHLEAEDERVAWSWAALNLTLPTDQDFVRTCPKLGSLQQAGDEEQFQVMSESLFVMDV